ncbi:MAG: hypothetical protein WKF73_15365 [Nocardioidaceae bacterium]
MTATTTTTTTGRRIADNADGPLAATETVILEQQILAKNDSLAARNRGWLSERGITALNVDELAWLGQDDSAHQDHYGAGRLRWSTAPNLCGRRRPRNSSRCRTHP